MLRGFFLISLLLTIAALAFLGFRGKKSADPPFELFPDMVRQPKIRAQAPSHFFQDGRGSRMPIDGTVPIGYEQPQAQTIATPVPAVPPAEPRERLAFSNAPDYYDTGKMGDHWGTGLPVEVTPDLMRRGRERFSITCAMCHGATAAGNGIAKQNGLATVVTLQDDRIRGMADGEIFNTITNGKNTMMAYGSVITVADRWAIISYLRALQRSQNAAIADVPENERAQLDKK
ncbi:MAG TPA: cytochrome c [Chthoniobacterales bacterium]|jgi:mono/diheme cytochrome c family protein